MDSQPWQDSTVGPTYRERLWPSPGVWLMVPVVAAAVFVTLMPVGTSTAVVAASAVTAGLVAWGVLSTPVVAVQDGELLAGRAHVPVSLVGSTAVARGEDARQERGPRLDARAYLLLRGWVDPVLKVQIVDPQDPTPYWLLSTRSPDALAQALERARAAS